MLAAAPGIILIVLVYVLSSIGVYGPDPWNQPQEHPSARDPQAALMRNNAQVQKGFQFFPGEAGCKSTEEPTFYEAGQTLLIVVNLFHF